MITSQQITRRASDDKVGARTVERDYVIHHILASLTAESEGLVFKGGTSLRACQFADYRYSADLDFSLVDLSHEVALAQIADALQRCHERTGISLAMTDSAGEGKPAISYIATLDRERSIKLDLQADELVEDTQVKEVIARFDDLPASLVLTYTVSETAAEKLRCVLQRTQCRDLFDLHHLFHNERLDPLEIWPAFDRKAVHRGKDPAQFGTRLETVLAYARAHWEEEMTEYVGAGQVMHLGQMERELRRALRPVLR